MRLQPCAPEWSRARSRRVSGSSYRWLAGFERAPEWFKPGPILESFGPDLATQQRELRKFTEAGVGITEAWVLGPGLRPERGYWGRVFAPRFISISSIALAFYGLWI